MTSCGDGELPQSVRDSYQHYYDHAEANDWATVYISNIRLMASQSTVATYGRLGQLHGC